VVTSDRLTDRAKATIVEMKGLLTTHTVPSGQTNVLIKRDRPSNAHLYTGHSVQLAKDLEKSGVAGLARDEFLFVATMPAPTAKQIDEYEAAQKANARYKVEQAKYLQMLRLSLLERQEPLTVEDALARIEELEMRLDDMETDR